MEQQAIICDPITHAGNEYNLRGDIVELITVTGLSNTLHDHKRISIGSIMCSRDIQTWQAFFDLYCTHTRSVPQADLTGCAFALLRCDQRAGGSSKRMGDWLAGPTNSELAQIAAEAEAALWLLDSEKLRLFEAVEQHHADLDDSFLLVE